MVKVNLFSVDDIISLTEVADVVTVDTEGVSRMLGFSLCFDGLQEGFYLPFTHEEADQNLTEAQKDKIYSVLQSREALTFHNAVHDLRVLYRAGFDYTGKFYDTMLMAHWVHEERQNYGIDKIAPLYGFQGKNMPEVMSFIIETEGWDKVPVALMNEYSSNDAWIQHQTFRKILPEFQAQGFDGELWEYEQEFIRKVMGPMIDLGIKVDTAFCVRKYMKAIGVMEECKKELGINPDSGKDLEKFLIDELGLPVAKRTKTGKPSFDKEAMEEYDFLLEKKKDKRAQTILRYRGWRKTSSSNYKPYMDYVKEGGILHPGYKLHGTRTGRLSCEKPALQQIPKASDKEWNGDLKQAFVARDGFELWTIDYSQLQFRMTVAYAVCETLLEIFNDPTRDIFDEMAAQMGWERADVKTLVYLILFGGGATRAAAAFGLDSVEEGAQLVNEFHALYPEIKAVSNECAKVARKLQYVRYWTGRRRHFFPYFFEGKKMQPKYYRAFNAVIQGGEAEIMKRAMIMLANTVCDENFRMVLQIHDEIAFEIREGMAEEYLPKAQKVMENAGKQFCDAIGTHVAFKTQAKRWGEK